MDCTATKMTARVPVDECLQVRTIAEVSSMSRKAADNKQSDAFANGFIKLASRTHDVSLVEEHVPSIEYLAADLEVAVKAAWPRRHHIRYTQVHVLLIIWEDDDLGVLSEIQDLEHVFDSMYHYRVETYEIPQAKPEKQLNRRILDFLNHEEESENECLLIVYYAGHAKRIYDSNEPPIWFA